MSLSYQLRLASGQTLTGDDERDPEDMLLAADEPLDDIEAPGWTWLAGHYIRVGETRAIAQISRPPSRGDLA
jgi:hypothetical protein